MRDNAAGTEILVEKKVDMVRKSSQRVRVKRMIVPSGDAHALCIALVVILIERQGSNEKTKKYTFNDQCNSESSVYLLKAIFYDSSTCERIQFGSCTASVFEIQVVVFPCFLYGRTQGSSL